MFDSLGRIPRNDKWKVFPKLVIDKNATMTATPNDIVTKVIEMEAAIKRENGLAPKALLLQGRVATAVMVVMAVKLVKVAEVQRGIREMIGKIIRETR
jgi:hypothetical protein